MKHRILSLALAALLLAGASGCSGDGTKQPDTAMGRYVETEVSFPEANVAQVLGVQAQADGIVDMLCYAHEEVGNYVSLVWYQSADSGATWTEKDCPALKEMFDTEENDAIVNSACWDADGRLYAYYEVYGEEGTTESGIAVVDESGAAKLGWPIPVSTDGSNVLVLRVADNGDLLLGGWAEVQQVDPKTGAVKNVYMPKDTINNSVDGWDVTGNTLWLSENDGIRSFDLTTGKEGETLPATTSTQNGSNYGTVYRMVSATTNGVYYADEHGLFRALPGSSVSEKLLDGNMCSLGLPSVERVSMTTVTDGLWC